ncbi:hypothetical protein [Alicyclobacillus acidiphilus]|uniref:glycoside hydrolase family 38 N-terminal domain-containing protein n=1 Tax=Alicyclobacillus acidiphilus TaxID=182455 RepID=UPI000834E722|nr:hypothetical protein [Alicyclobacillus acidiphilus]
MTDLNRELVLYLIHHSHTDIGYTDRQEKIERYHEDFIRQAITAVELARSGEREEWRGFKWVCETFWPVERFLIRSTDDWRHRFVEALRRREIELSANYLNMTELLDDVLTRQLISKAVDFANSIGVRVSCAMTADINGYGWGFSQALVDAGIVNLFSCVHTHHGMYPGFRNQTPFWWVTPRGDKLLVWNGEHYHLGNRLGLAPNAITSEAIATAEARVEAYLTQLREQDYEFPFVPIMVSGLFTDNGPPNPAIAALANAWNAEHARNCRIEMTTLSDFFKIVRRYEAEIPVYRGDWPDWWSDGVASTPRQTQLFRDAQRTRRVLQRLCPDTRRAPSERLLEADANLAMYSEHTWGYSASVQEPWNPNVQSLLARKEAYAANAHRLVYTELDDLLEQHGECSLRPRLSARFRILNAFDESVDSVVSLHFHHWEANALDGHVNVIDERDGRSLEYQVGPSSRGMCLYVPVSLGPRDESTLRIVKQPDCASSKESLQVLVNRVNDLSLLSAISHSRRELTFTESSIESPYVRLSWRPESGIWSWLDKRSGEELIRPDCVHGAFTPIYECTRGKDMNEITAIRSRMGRNRKGLPVERSIGRLVASKVIVKGPLFVTLELEYKIPGLRYYGVRLTVYRDYPQVDVSIRIHKESVWEPENLYVSLPFGRRREVGQHGGQLWIEKAGAVLQPRIDQIPGSLVDYYCVQEGIAFILPTTVAEGTTHPNHFIGIAVGVPDTPLIQVGPIEYGDRLLQGHPDLEQDPEHVYSWVMNNFWETNFKAEVGGFYEFRYHVAWGPEFQDPNVAVQHCHQMNVGTLCFRIEEAQAQ